MKIKCEGHEVDVRDALCAFRPCLWPGQWKGVLTKGTGYQYAPESDWHWRCFRRDDRGCPDPLPELDPSKAKCCDAPKVRVVAPDAYGRRPQRQRCQNCGAWLTGYVLEVARNGA